MKLIIIIHLLFTGQFVLAQSQDSLSLPDLIPYKVDNKFGYCNPQLQMVIEPKFDFAEPFRKQCWEISDYGNHSQKFSSEETATVLLNGKRYLINNRGVITDSISSEYTEEENCYFIKQSSFKEQPRYECFEGIANQLIVIVFAGRYLNKS
ncbi:MAG: WG repeat-containing protein [Chitinophagaceae bacterium]|nr:WG repeat-containing protein [Chitinophagaceae bacterium]